MFNQKTKKLINHLLISALIFAIPSNLFLILTEKSAYIHGLRIDYLLSKFYLSDIIILLLTTWLFFSKQIKIPQLKLSKKVWLISVTILFLLFQLLTKSPLIVGWQIFKIIEILWLVFILNILWPKLKPAFILLSANLAMIFQSIIGLLQFFNQKSVAGYWLLGEPNLAKQIGMAKQVIFGQNFILPYGTTPHPNVLGGFITIVLILNFLFLLKKKPEKSLLVFLSSTSVLGLITLFLTNSWSAGFSLLFASLLIFFKPNIKNLLFISISIWLIATIFITKVNLFVKTTDPSLVRRQYLNQAAIKMIVDHPLLGVGLNNFTIQVEKYSPTREVVRFTQPAHNTPLLLWSEIGLVGTALILFWFRKSGASWLKPLTMTCTAILPILILDHYLYTLQVGNLLFAVLLVSFKSFLNPLQK